MNFFFEDLLCISEIEERRKRQVLVLRSRANANTEVELSDFGD